MINNICKNCGSYGGNVGCDVCGPPIRERIAQDRLALTPCSPSLLFDVDMLKRAIMDDSAAEKFRRESKQILLRDPETQAVAECYRHPDGRVLIAAIRLSENADGEARADSASPPQDQTL